MILAPGPLVNPRAAAPPRPTIRRLTAPRRHLPGLPSPARCTVSLRRSRPLLQSKRHGLGQHVHLLVPALIVVRAGGVREDSVRPHAALPHRMRHPVAAGAEPAEDDVLLLEVNFLFECVLGGAGGYVLLLVNLSTGDD